MNKTIEEKGREGEELLNKWLNGSGLSYVSIAQSRETFAPLFGTGLKRPDFLVLLESIGLIGVDAKNHRRSGGVLTLELEYELKRALMFERVFRLPMWFAFVDRVMSGSWLWISALKAIEVGEIRHNKRKGVEFIAIPLKEFAQIAVGDDMGKLYTQRMPGFSKTAQRLDAFPPSDGGREARGPADRASASER